MSVNILGTSWDQCVSTVQYCFTSMETIRLVRTEPRTATSTLTQLLNYEIILCYAVRIFVPLVQNVSHLLTQITKRAEQPLVAWKGGLPQIFADGLSYYLQQAFLNHFFQTFESIFMESAFYCSTKPALSVTVSQSIFQFSFMILFGFEFMFIYGIRSGVNGGVKF